MFVSSDEVQAYHGAGTVDSSSLEDCAVKANTLYGAAAKRLSQRFKALRGLIDSADAISLPVKLAGEAHAHASHAHDDYVHGYLLFRRLRKRDAITVDMVLLANDIRGTPQSTR